MPRRSIKAWVFVRREIGEVSIGEEIEEGEEEGEGARPGGR